MDSSDEFLKEEEINLYVMKNHKENKINNITFKFTYN